MFLFCLSKAVRREPGHGLFDQLGDVRAVSRDDGLLLQALVEIDVLGLRNGVLQIVVVVRKAGIRLIWQMLQACRMALTGTP